MIKPILGLICKTITKSIQKEELDVQTQLENYMKDKYKEEFKSGSCSPANWAYSSDSMNLYSEKFPGEAIEVYRYKRKEGRKTVYDFRDNYLAFKYRDEIEREIKSIMEPLFGRCTPIMHPSGHPVHADLSADATIEEYLKNEPVMTNVYIYIEKYAESINYIENTEKLRLKFKEKSLPRYISIWFLKPDKNILDELDRFNEHDITCGIEEDSVYMKEVHYSFNNEYELDNEDLEQFK